MTDIIEFTKSLGIELGIGQRMFLKLAYGMEFDDSVLYEVEDPLKVYEPRQMTEKQLFKHLSENNILFGEKNSRLVSAVCGRRSGKTLLGSLVMAYELESFLRKSKDPCKEYHFVSGSKFFFSFFGPNLNSSCFILDTFLNLVRLNPFLESRIGSKTFDSVVFLTEEDIEKGRKGTVVVDSNSFGPASVRGKNYYMVVMDEIESCFDFKKVFQLICSSLLRYSDNLNFTFSSRKNLGNPMTSFCNPRFIFRSETTLMNPRSLSGNDVKHMIQNNFKNFIEDFCV